MYWFWMVLFTAIFLHSAYCIFYKEPKLKEIASNTNDYATDKDMVNYIDAATDKPLDVFLFVSTAIILTHELGIL